MREILFRGKVVNLHNGSKDFVYGQYVQNRDGKMIYSDTWEDGIQKHYVIEGTVGQYTGLTDKNGKKIFEGDIIKFGISQRLMYVHWNEETLTWELTDVGVPACEVNHLNNTFDLGEIQVESAYGEMFSEVVGNIHDNFKVLNN